MPGHSVCVESLTKSTLTCIHFFLSFLINVLLQQYGGRRVVPACFSWMERTTVFFVFRYGTFNILIDFYSDHKRTCEHFRKLRRHRK